MHNEHVFFSNRTVCWMPSAIIWENIVCNCMLADIIVRSYTTPLQKLILTFQELKRFYLWFLSASWSVIRYWHRLENILPKFRKLIKLTTSIWKNIILNRIRLPTTADSFLYKYNIPCIFDIHVSHILPSLQ